MVHDRLRLQREHEILTRFVESDGWAIVCGLMAAAREGMRDELETAALDQRGVDRRQGVCEGLRRVREMPQARLAELDRLLTKGETHGG